MTLEQNAERKPFFTSRIRHQTDYKATEEPWKETCTLPISPLQAEVVSVACPLVSIATERLSKTIHH